MENRTLQDARSLLAERFRLDSRDSGALNDYHQRCAIELKYVVAELDVMLYKVQLLEDQVQQLLENLATANRQQFDPNNGVW